MGARLGGFALERLIGRGGMAEVWLGRHPRVERPAAIKVITRGRAHDPRFRAGFRREVRAVAGLDHPGIVPVLDAGVVPPGAEALVPGSPWLAMELAERGELRRLPIPMAWPVLRDVLLQLLDALAHAHARDVVHRDLKPENVLLRMSGDRLRLMLTDFGIAHLIAPEGLKTADAGGASAGTPRYMAPEQLRGEWRDFGPATDLYALGCMAFELAGGAPPYVGTSPFMVASQHLSGPIPRVEPAHAVPAGFADWVQRLMQRDPHARYTHAADAAWALSALPAPPIEGARRAWQAALAGLAGLAGPEGAGQGEATVIDGAPALPRAAIRDRVTLAFDPRPPAGWDQGADRPPLPGTWYVDQPRRPLLRGVGLGLFGVRALPFAGRDGARNRLWDALRRVEVERRAEMVLIEGPEGVGKTALAEWFTRRARELGAADALPFTFGAMDGGGDAVAAGLRAWFRGQGLDQPALIERIAAELGHRDPDQRALIEAVVAPSLGRIIERSLDDVVLSPTERHAAERDLLRIAARARPLVVLYDGLDACPDTQRFVDWLLDRPLAAPVLLIATARGAVLPGIAARVTRLALEPLGAEAHAAVVEELLGLAPALSRTLRADTGGNPLFAVQTVTEWVESGALAPTPAGYAARSGVSLTVPPTLEALADRRIARIVDGLPDPAGARRALEVAAALGDAVDDGEWRAACAGVGVAPSEALEAALYDAGIARAGRGGWLFAHAFVRRALLDRMRGSPRWAAVHRACAAAARVGRSPTTRRARHLIAAGALPEAIDALAVAAGERLDGGDYTRALELCAERAALIERAGLPADDVRRLRTWPIEISALRFTGRPADSLALAARFDRAAIDPAHLDVLAERARIRGARAAFMGDAEANADGYQEAVALYHRLGDARGMARALHGLGWSRLLYGRFADAVEVMRRSRRVAAEAGWRVDEGWACHGETAARLFGELGGVEGPLADAERIFAAIRLPSGTGLIRAERADMALLAGDTAAARRHAEAALEIFSANGSHLVFRAEISLAMAEVFGDALAAAYARVWRVIDARVMFRAARQHAFGGFAIGAWTALRMGDDARFAAALAAIEADGVRRFMHPVARRALVPLGELLEARDRAGEAARVWGLAASYWRPVDAELAEGCAARAAAMAARC